MVRVFIVSWAGGGGKRWGVVGGRLLIEIGCVPADVWLAGGRPKRSSDRMKSRRDAEGAEVYWEEKRDLHPGRFQQLL